MKSPVSVARRATAAAAARLLAAPTRARQIPTAGGHARVRSSLTRSRALAFVVVLMMLGTLVAPVGGAIAATGAAAGADAGPPGLDRVPEENVGPPDHAQGGGPPDQALDNIPTHASAWDVHASQYAGDLEVTVGATADGELQLTFADDRNHYGRQVAVDAATLEDANGGERPAVAFGMHSSGDEWSAEIEYRDGMAYWTIPKFSSNEVTFEGTVSLSGSPATDGTTYRYDLADSDEPDNISVTLTGRENTGTWTSTERGNPHGASWTESFGGTTDATVDVTISRAMGETMEWSDTRSNDIHELGAAGDRVASGVYGELVMYNSDGTTAWSHPFEREPRMDMDSTAIVAGEDDVGGANVTLFDAGTGEIQWNYSESGQVRDIEISDNYVVLSSSWGDETRLLNRSDGSHIWTVSPNSNYHHVSTDETNIVTGDWDGAVKMMDMDGNVQWSDSVGDKVRDVQLVNGVAYVAVDNTGIIAYDAGTGDQLWTSNAATSVARDNLHYYNGELAALDSGEIYGIDTADGSQIWTSSLTGLDAIAYNNDRLAVGDGTTLEYRLAMPAPQDPSVTVGGSTAVSVSGELAGQETGTTQQSPGDADIAVDIANNGRLNVELAVTETTETIDPSVTVNGDTYTHAGTLADGETTSLDVSTTSLQSGENVVDIAVSTDYSGPVGQVGFDYSHSATDAQTVDYEGEAFSERYNVSKTFAYDAEGASLTIPFATEVVDVRQLEVREDGGNWTTVGESDYSLNDTELTVALGSVSANTTVDVRAVGSKVNPVDGEITVTEPTVLGETLTTEIRLEAVGTDFALEVGSTDYADELMYTYSESWSNPQTFSRVDSNGDQEIRMPNAGEGETTRVSTLVLGVEPASGHVDVRVLAAGSEPEFEVLEETTATEIDFVWHDTVSGHVYQLYSLDADRERARGEAASPVTLTHDGTAETLRIIDLGTGGSGGSGAGARGTADGGILTGPITMIIAVTAALAGLYLLSRRTGDDSVSGRFIILLAVPIIGAVAIFALAPQIWSDELASALGEALPLIAMFAAVGVYLWYRAARSPDEQVTLQIGDR